MLLLSRMRDFFPSLPPPSVCCHPHLPLKAGFFLSLLLIISVLTLHSLSNNPSSISPLCFALSFSHSHPPPPLFLQLSGRGYLRLRSIKPALGVFAFVTFPKWCIDCHIVSWWSWFRHCPSEENFVWFSGNSRPGRSSAIPPAGLKHWSCR